MYHPPPPQKKHNHPLPNNMYYTRLTRSLCLVYIMVGLLNVIRNLIHLPLVLRELVCDLLDLLFSSIGTDLGVLCLVEGTLGCITVAICGEQEAYLFIPNALYLL